MKLRCKPLAFTSRKTILKNKKSSGTNLPALFSAWCLKKNIFLVIFYYLTKFHCLVALNSWDIGQYVYCNCLLTRLWRHRFWNYPYLSNQAVFSTCAKSQHKKINIIGTKSFLRWSKKHFLSVKGFSLKEIKHFFGRWECDFEEFGRLCFFKIIFIFSTNFCNEGNQDINLTSAKLWNYMPENDPCNNKKHGKNNNQIR